jgi:hypothetical protein
MAQVFISYSRKDKEFVRRLGDALVAQKREAWVDWKDIAPTAEWRQEIFANIEAADNFLFIISPESVASANCRKEIDHAVANHKRMVPIFYRAVPDDAIPETLGKFQRIDFDGDVRFDENFAALINALDTDLAWTQAHTRLLMRAKEWEREGKDSSFVLRGRDLRDAEQWVAKSSGKEPSPTTLQSQYIVASRLAATKLQRIVIGAVAAAFLVAAGLAIYAFGQKSVAQVETKEAQTQREKADANAITAQKNADEATRQRSTAVANEAEAKRQQGIAERQTVIAKQQTAEAQKEAAMARARELVASSILNEDRDPELSLLLAAHAVAAIWPAGRTILPEAEQQLHRAIMASHVQLTLRGHNGNVVSVTWSPDGKRLATGSADNTAKVWDAETGKEVLSLSGHSESVNSVAWSLDGKQLATGSSDKTAKVWDAETGKEVLTLSGHSGSVNSVAWSPNGKRLATGSWDNTAKVWDTKTGKEVMTLRSHRNIIVLDVYGVAWSPDGKRLATVSGGGQRREGVGRRDGQGSVDP